ILFISAHTYYQTQAYHTPSFPVILKGCTDVNVGRIFTVRANVSSSLTHCVTTYVLRIAGANGGKEITPVEHAKPIPVQPHDVSLLGTGIDDLHGISRKSPVASINAGGRQMMVRAKGPEVIVNILCMIQDHHADLFVIAHILNYPVPVVGAVINGGRPSNCREHIEVANLRRHFIAGYRCEPAAKRQCLCGRLQIRVDVMVGEYGKFDTLSRDCDRTILQACITVTGMGKRVDVRITTHPTLGGNLAADAESPFKIFTGFQFEANGIHTILETSSGIWGVCACRKCDRRVAGSGVYVT